MKYPTYAPFPHTHWSLVQRAGVPDRQARRDALATLLQRYQPALQSYLLSTRRLPQSTSEELLSSFMADKFLQQAFLGAADPKRGRFRTFLLTSLNHYIASSGRKLKVRYVQPLVRGEERLDLVTAEAAVEAEWARALILGVIRAMHQECEETGRLDIWAVFQGRILGVMFENRPLVSYAKLTSDLRLSSPTQAANLLITAKRMYARLLRIAVGEYETETDITDEILELQAILRRVHEQQPPLQ